MIKIAKPLYRQAAFTIFELLIILVVLVILTTQVQSRFLASNDFKQDSAITQIISAARLAQQISMNDASRTVVLVIQENQIDLQIDGSSINLNLLDFPINFGSQISLSPIGNISFDSLGRTTLQTLNIQANTLQQICFEESGYIHSC